MSKIGLSLLKLGKPKIGLIKTKYKEEFMEDQNILGTILGFLFIFVFLSFSYHVRQYISLRKEKRLKLSQKIS